MVDERQPLRAERNWKVIAQAALFESPIRTEEAVRQALADCLRNIMWKLVRREREETSSWLYELPVWIDVEVTTERWDVVVKVTCMSASKYDKGDKEIREAGNDR